MVDADKSSTIPSREPRLLSLASCAALSGRQQLIAFTDVAGTNPAGKVFTNNNVQAFSD